MKFYTAAQAARATRKQRKKLALTLIADELPWLVEAINAHIESGDQSATFNLNDGEGAVITDEHQHALSVLGFRVGPVRFGETHIDVLWC